MPVPQALVTRYFQLVVNRQFTEAERELERIKQKMQKTEWNRGYFRALYGMLLSRKANGESYAFLTKLDMSDKAVLHAHKREFLSHVSNRLHGDFDRGFFSAWADCMRVLGRMEIPNYLNANNASIDNGKLKTVKADEVQATMENFIEEEKD